jgi:hypothetical protein
MTLSDLPVWYVPSIPVMGFGLFIMPLLCLALLVIVAARFALVRPRPYSLIAFFGSVALAGFVSCGSLWWNYSLQTLIAMFLTGFLVVGEVLVRGLLRHYATAGTAIVVCCGYYFILLSAVCCAAV